MYPKDLNYTMPAEWAKHQRTFISWPVQASMCFPDNHVSVCQGYADIIAAMAEFEPVTVLVNPDELERVKSLVGGTNVTLLPIEHSDAWLRDNGPTFVVNKEGKLAGVNWKFNAWGGKYAPWDLDDKVAPQILEQLKVTRFDAPLVMEGGSIHTDGEGTLLTTEECLLNVNRNPELGRGDIENYVMKYTGTESIIWLKRGLSGDETDGHVDNIACFAAPGKVIIQFCEDPQDENYEITAENVRILENAIDAQGRKLEIIKIQQPPRVDGEEGRLTLSYLNFYFVNGGIILPVFGGTAAETDRLAEQVLTELFPDRRIRTVNGMAVITEGGNVHCTTQQMPVSI
ncbi:agmatine deiminase family protein [Paenibacillus sp. 19GGS1-52]|uniref:agmatine deiminase family protein n=1 Tax=Paenibacillus sp. 19GGS1-52 TaxID=2758563 RepID=UPI001EFB5AD4|nr:agmatine deiminase family protein [Paenibacillus sp. 19GGS1-52]ULO07289.1 agmatine deiminase family protein [Paenibacillus sp. 19GGS1-52]